MKKPIYLLVVLSTKCVCIQILDNQQLLWPIWTHPTLPFLVHQSITCLILKEITHINIKALGKNLKLKSCGYKMLRSCKCLYLNNNDFNLLSRMVRALEKITYYSTNLARRGTNLNLLKMALFHWYGAFLSAKKGYE